MRLRTIWTMRAMSLRERINRTEEEFWRRLAHRLPRRLAYWSFIDSGVRLIGRSETVPEVIYTDLLRRAGAWVGEPDQGGSLDGLCRCGHPVDVHGVNGCAAWTLGCRCRTTPAHDPAEVPAEVPGTADGGAR